MKIGRVKENKRSNKVKATLSVLKKVLYNNQNMNITWFLLNKQAAFSGVVVIVEEEGESPLGPIKITIKNKDIEEIIKWFENVNKNKNGKIKGNIKRLNCNHYYYSAERSQ